MQKVSVTRLLYNYSEVDAKGSTKKSKRIYSSPDTFNAISMLCLSMTNAFSSIHFPTYTYILTRLLALTWMGNTSKPFRLQYLR